LPRVASTRSARGSGPGFAARSAALSRLLRGRSQSHTGRGSRPSLYRHRSWRQYHRCVALPTCSGPRTSLRFSRETAAGSRLRHACVGAMLAGATRVGRPAESVANRPTRGVAGAMRSPGPQELYCGATGTARGMHEGLRGGVP
jgi:hypothetical protein